MEVKKDIVYLSGSTHPKHTLDVYTPEKSKGCIVWFHGGGLSGGQKDNEETVHVAKTLAGRGYTVASVNYRLYPDVAYPGQVEDAAAAVRYAHENVYDGKGPFVVSGHSAGGWMTGMVVMNPEYLPAGMVDGFIPVSGQMALHTAVAAELNIQAADPDHPAAPSAHVRDGLPPVLLIAGDHDNPGRWDQQVMLDERLARAGHPDHRAVQIPDRDHCGTIRQMGEPGDPVIEEVDRFISGLKKD